VTTPLVSDLLAFLRASPTPYHAVESATARLAAVGFRALDPTEPWGDLGPGRYWVTAGDATVIAFVVPSRKNLRGFRIVGAHTDSPNLRLKPKPEYTKEGYTQLGVEVYGGALLNSWLDRDLSLAGRVLVREGGALRARLVKIDRPLCRIPQLAIHLDREVVERGLVLNKQEHLAPVLGLASGGSGSEQLAALCAAELEIDKDSIAGLDLMLYDVVSPVVAGESNEFIFSSRLDNQAMCHAAVRALADVAARADEGEIVPVIALFDHEEVGSASAHGAQSAFLPRVLERIAGAGGRSRDDFHRILSGSMCVSADMAHAVHPNYADRHEPRHKPVLNGGPVIKVNAQQRYATSATTGALFADLCAQADVPVQHYAHRTDLPCGSTIGPITATLLGIPTVDVGNPMLSMHSVREMAGTRDPECMVAVLVRFFAYPGP
jgi:aspartyl aminopeptidase